MSLDELNAEREALNDDIAAGYGADVGDDLPAMQARLKEVTVEIQTRETARILRGEKAEPAKKPAKKKKPRKAAPAELTADQKKLAAELESITNINDAIKFVRSIDGDNSPRVKLLQRISKLLPVELDIVTLNNASKRLSPALAKRASKSLGTHAAVFSGHRLGYRGVIVLDSDHKLLQDRAMAAEVVTHELIHGSTSQVTRRAQDYDAPASKKVKDAVTELEAILKEVQKHEFTGEFNYDGQAEHMVANIQELLAYGLSSELAQKNLNSIEYTFKGEIKNAWRGFVEALAKLLNLDVNENSALESLLVTSEKLFNAFANENIIMIDDEAPGKMTALDRQLEVEYLEFIVSQETLDNHPDLLETVEERLAALTDYEPKPPVKQVRTPTSTPKKPTTPPKAAPVAKVEPAAAALAKHQSFQEPYVLSGEVSDIDARYKAARALADAYVKIRFGSDVTLPNHRNNGKNITKAAVEAWLVEHLPMDAQELLEGRVYKKKTAALTVRRRIGGKTQVVPATAENLYHVALSAWNEVERDQVTHNKKWGKVTGTEKSKLYMLYLYNELQAEARNDVALIKDVKEATIAEGLTPKETTEQEQREALIGDHEARREAERAAAAILRAKIEALTGVSRVDRMELQREASEQIVAAQRRSAESYVKHAKGLTNEELDAIVKKTMRDSEIELSEETGSELTNEELDIGPTAYEPKTRTELNIALKKVNKALWNKPSKKKEAALNAEVEELEARIDAIPDMQEAVFDVSTERKVENYAKKIKRINESIRVQTNVNKAAKTPAGKKKAADVQAQAVADAAREIYKDVFGTLKGFKDLPKDEREALLRMTDVPQNGYESSAELIKGLKVRFDSKAVNDAIGAGRLKIYDTVSDLSAEYRAIIDAKHADNGQVPAGFYADGAVHLIAGNLNSDTAVRTLVHEAGVHAGWQSVLGEESFNNELRKIRDVRRRVARNGAHTRLETAVANAEKRAKAAGTPEVHMDEEVLAYMVDNNVQLPVVRRIIVKIRQWLRTLGLINPDNMSPEEYGQLARVISQHWLLGNAEFAAKRAPKRQPMFSKIPDADGQQAVHRVLVGMRQEINKPDEQTAMQKADAKLREEAGKWSDPAKVHVRWTDKWVGLMHSRSSPTQSVIRRGLRKQSVVGDEFIGRNLLVSDSQAAHAGAVSSVFVNMGDLKYDTSTGKWHGVDSPNNYVALVGVIERMAVKHNMDQHVAEAIAHNAFIARRYDAILKARQRAEAKAAQLRAVGTKAAKAKAVKMEKEAYRIYIPETWDESVIAHGLKLVKDLPELNKAFKIWDGMRANVLKVMETGGILSDVQRDNLLNTMGYVPFNRDTYAGGKYNMELDLTEALVKHAHHVEATDPIRAIKGSEADVHDIFDNIQRLMVDMVDASVQNRLGRNAVRELVNVKNAVKLTEQDVGRTPKKEIVRVYEDGEEVHYKVDDPYITHMFRGLDGGGSSLIKFLAIPSNFVRHWIVRNPVFSLGQLTQDAMGAITNSGLPPSQTYKLLAAVPAEFAKILAGKSEGFNELYKLGAVGVRDWSAVTNQHDQQIRAHLVKDSRWKQFVHKLDNFSMASDNAVRVVVYNLSLEIGLSKAEAEEKAFEIINFRRKGSFAALAAASRVVPFLSAAMAAMYVIGKVLSGNGISGNADRKAAWEIYAMNASMMALGGLLLAMMNGDDDDYKEMDPYIRDRGIHLPGMGNWIIPMRMDFTSWPKIVAEELYNLWTGNAYTDRTKAMKAIADATINSLTGPLPMPQILKPTLEIVTDHSFLTGRQIVGPSYDGVVGFRQYNASTSEMAKALAKLTDVLPGGSWSALKLDHFIYGSLGSVGQGLRLLSNISPLSKLTDGGERADQSWEEWLRQVPSMGRFISTEFGKGPLNSLYRFDREEIGPVVNSVNRWKNAGQTAEALDFLSKNKNAARYNVRNYAAKYRRQLREFVTEHNRIARSRLDPAEKKVLIDHLKKIQQDWAIAQQPELQLLNKYINAW